MTDSQGMAYGSILAVDIGSTMTKLVMIERQDDEHQVAGRSEAKTTVEAPQEDVMLGLRAAVRQMEELTSRTLLDEETLIVPRRTDGSGVDALVATSSAGGGLQMICVGLMRALTAESAERAALGAGAIVMDVVAADDSRSVVERVHLLRNQRPDMILLAGGTDEGNISHVAAMAEYVGSAKSRPRLGDEYEMPVIYAGNAKARDVVRHMVGDDVQLHVVSNIRPTLEEEVLEPVRDKIGELFLDHVMAHAPGYRTVLDWTDRRIQPTPAAVGRMMRLMAEDYDVNVIGLDIGGATTDVFSVMGGVFNRSVSANLGMSYSIANVFNECGEGGVQRWLPIPIPERELRNWVYNKTIRPTGLPITLPELMLEHAVGREALRQAFAEHREMAVGLKGIEMERTFDHALDQTPSGQPLVNLNEIDVVIGSGGLLSHAPRRTQAAAMMMDSLQPEGIIRLYVDNEFMIPQLGAVAEIAPDVAREIFVRHCLVPLGTVIAPAGTGRTGTPMAEAKILRANGEEISTMIRVGDLEVIPLGADETAEVQLHPRGSFDMGDGPGMRVQAEVRGGEVGLIVDGRGRPLHFPRNERRRRGSVRTWLDRLNVYPADLVEEYAALYGEEDG